ncbi:hypothetical protein LCGC14_1348970 [marine sediment metagenome]|uniref:PPM-type phosphatase domain-containing protein n=1 Tax=marine sediment metagenome TaxID=412755 RepID=A0A0F9KC56_9ZZZZ
MAKEIEQARKQELAIHKVIADTVSQPLDLDKLLDTALEKIMEVMNVDTGGIFLLEPETGQYVLRRHRNLTEQFIQEMGRVSLGEGCTGTAAKTGEIYCAFAMAEREYLCEDAERLMGTDCLAAAPIMVAGRAVGVIELFAPSARRISDIEADMITTIGNQIGIAIENTRLYQETKQNVTKLSKLKNQLEQTNTTLRRHLDHEAYIAETLQKGLLPLELPKLEGYEIAARYISATKEASVGGDFYDFIPVEKNIAIVVGDISGSGIETTTMSSMLKNTARAFALEDATPSDVINRANNVLFKEAPPEKFATAFYALLEPEKGKIAYASAGHPSALLAKRDANVIEELPQCSPALAITESLDCVQSEVMLNSGDVLTIFTDGLIEVRKNKTFFGLERLKDEILGQPSIISASDLADRILTEAQDFSGGVFADDIVLIILKRK